MHITLFLSLSASTLAQSLLFAPPTLSLQVGEGNFTVSLSSAPSADFSVSLSQDVFQFSTCSLVFNKDNWNLPQLVHLVAPPAFSASNTTVNVPFHLCGGNTIQNYQITPAALQLETCVSKGDPHYLTFSGDYFSYMGKGSYYLYHSDILDIQTLLCEIPGASSSVTWNCKVGIRYASTAYVFVLGADYINATLVQGTLASSPIQVFQTDKEAKAFEIDLPSKSGKIVLTRGLGLNVQTTLCPRQYPLAGASASGLCFGQGNLVSVPDSNDLFKGNCASTPLQLHNNLLSCPASPSTCPVISSKPSISSKNTTSSKPSTSSKNSTIPSLPQNQTLLIPSPPPGCTPLTTCPQYDPKVIQNLTCPAFKPIDYSTAHGRCSSIIVDLNVSTVNIDFFVKSCADDYSNTGDASYLESSRVAYTSGCHAHVQYEIDNSYSESTRQEYKKIADSCGFGNASCGDCGTNGYCGAAGCECNQGYGGGKCEYNLSQPQSIKASLGHRLVDVGMVGLVGLVLLAF